MKAVETVDYSTFDRATTAQMPTGRDGGAYVHGMNAVLEGIRQVRGSSAKQIPDVEHSLAGSLSGGAILARP